MMDIAEVAKQSGVPASTLRYYEERGLIASVGRQGLRRLFTPDIVERLALIALGRAAGLSLEDIAQMFAPDGSPRINRQLLAAKADEIERSIKKLKTMRDGLRHAAECTAANHLDCPTFRRLMGLAVAHPLPKRKQPRTNR